MAMEKIPKQVVVIFVMQVSEAVTVDMYTAVRIFLSCPLEHKLRCRIIQRIAILLLDCRRDLEKIQLEIQRL